MGNSYLIANSEKREYFWAAGLDLSWYDGLIAEILFKLCKDGGRWDDNEIIYVKDQYGQSEEYGNIQENYKDINPYLKKEFKEDLELFKSKEKASQAQRKELYDVAYKNAEVHLKREILARIKELVKLDEANLSKLEKELKVD